MNNKKNDYKIIAIIFAILSAVLYAFNAPFSKIVLENVTSSMMAGILYIGEGIGMLIIFLLTKQYKANNKLVKNDVPFMIGIIILDIFAPICLLIGLKECNVSVASLLNNFEIVVTTIVAIIFLKEKVPLKLWIGIILITISSIILSVNGSLNFEESKGAIYILLGTSFWGIENVLTKRISNKNTFEIVALKGLCSGSGATIIALILGEKIPSINYIILIMILGFTTYGLSLVFYIKSQNVLGASKTSAYYAINPFIGTLLSFLILKEAITINYVIGLIIMIIGSIFVVNDTLDEKNRKE